MVEPQVEQASKSYCIVASVSGIFARCVWPRCFDAHLGFTHFVLFSRHDIRCLASDPGNLPVLRTFAMLRRLSRFKTAAAFVTVWLVCHALHAAAIVMHAGSFHFYIAPYLLRLLLLDRFHVCCHLFRRGPSVC